LEGHDTVVARTVYAPGGIMSETKDPGPAYAYTGRSHALRRFIEGNLMEGDLAVVREVLEEVLKKGLEDDLGKEDVPVFAQFTTVLMAELSRTSLLPAKDAEVTEGVAEAVGDALEAILQTTHERFIKKLIEEPYGVSLEEMKEVGIDELVRVVLEAVDQIMTQSSLIDASQVYKVTSRLDPSIRSYVEAQFLKAGFAPTVSGISISSIPSTSLIGPIIEVHPDVPDGEDIPF
jgi:hypothetical protein